MVGLGERRFWKKSPPRPVFDWLAWSLLATSVASTLGGISYSVRGFAVSQGGALPADWVAGIVAWGGVLLAIGAEGGTLAACIEVARKFFEKRATWVDMVAVAVSFVATVSARLLALGENQTLWAMWVLVVSAVADGYALYFEYGLHNTHRDELWERWYAANELFEVGDVQGAVKALRGQMPASARKSSGNGGGGSGGGGKSREKKPTRADEVVPVVPPARVRIRLPRFRDEVARMNGGLSPFAQELREPRANRADVVNAWLWSRGFERIPEGTARDWAKVVVAVAESREGTAKSR